MAPSQDEGGRSPARVHCTDQPAPAPDAPASGRRLASERAEPSRHKRRRSVSECHRATNRGSGAHGGTEVEVQQEPKHPGGVWKAEARLTIMELWVKFVDSNNSKPGASWQLSLGNAAKWVSGHQLLTSAWGPIKPLAVKRVLESIKGYIETRSHTPTGMGAAELRVYQENKDEVQATDAEPGGHGHGCGGLYWQESKDHGYHDWVSSAPLSTDILPTGTHLKHTFPGLHHPRGRQAPALPSRLFCPRDLNVFELSPGLPPACIVRAPALRPGHASRGRQALALPPPPLTACGHRDKALVPELPPPPGRRAHALPCPPALLAAVYAFNLRCEQSQRGREKPIRRAVIRPDVIQRGGAR